MWPCGVEAVSSRPGMSAETLRKLMRQAEIDAGEAVGVPREEKRALRCKCREPESIIGIPSFSKRGRSALAQSGGETGAAGRSRRVSRHRRGVVDSVLRAVLQLEAEYFARPTPESARAQSKRMVHLASAGAA